MSDLCLLCGKNKADQYPKMECLKGLCNNCIVKIKSKVKNTRKQTIKDPNETSIAQRIQNLQIKIKQLKKTIEILLELYNNVAPAYSAATPSAIPSVSTPNDQKEKKFMHKPDSPYKQSVEFLGETRPLKDSEKKNDIKCPYCNNSIDSKLYFYPLVIHKCGKGYYHQECFAKLMAEGNYECLGCHQNLFKRL